MCAYVRSQWNNLCTYKLLALLIKYTNNTEKEYLLQYFSIMLMLPIIILIYYLSPVTMSYLICKKLRGIWKSPSFGRHGG